MKNVKPCETIRIIRSIRQQKKTYFKVRLCSRRAAANTATASLSSEGCISNLLDFIGLGSPKVRSSLPIRIHYPVSIGSKVESLHIFRNSVLIDLRFEKKNTRHIQTQDLQITPLADLCDLWKIHAAPLAGTMTSVGRKPGVKPS